jgi:uncharacterized membrane protein
MIVALLGIGCGVIARYAQLEPRLFWQDEAVAAVRISGHGASDYVPLFDGRIHAASELAAMQVLAPGRGIGETFASIVREEPQRNPLYYVAARLWAGIFGDGIAALRAFSATLGLIGIGLGYVLGARLTRSPLGGLILAALIAVSPVQLRYSQQVREYILFADLVALSLWFFLRALDRPAWSRWAAYGGAVAAGLYAGPQFVVLALGLGLVFVRSRNYGRRTIVGFVLASLAALVLFAPWFYLNIHAAPHTSSDVAWASGPYPLQSFVVKWAFNIGAVFFDTELATRALAIFLVPIYAIVGFALYRLYRAPHDEAIQKLVWIPIFASSLPLVLFDIVRHAHYEAVTRYQLTTWIGIELAVALVLAGAMTSLNRAARAGASVAFAYLIACGAFAAFAGGRYTVWWDNNEHFSEAAVARTIAAQPGATVVIELAKQNYALVLSRYLPPQTKLLLYTQRLPDSALRLPAPAFAFLPSANERTQLAAARIRLENASPATELAVPDLRAQDPSGDDDISAQNALWKLSGK